MKIKKTAMIMAAVATMAVSSICSASMGSQLDKNDKTSVNFINTITQKDSEASFDSIQGSFDENMKKNMTSAQFKTKQKEVAEKLGKLEQIDFNSYVKRYDNKKNEVAIVSYLAKFSKQQFVIITMIYDKNGKMVEFGLNAIQPQQQKAAAPKEAAKK